MRKKLKAIIQHPLISGSSVIFLGTLLGNVFNFFFTVYMLANLSGADNGILAAVVSLITIPSLAAGAIAPAIVNFSGAYFAKNEIEKAHDLYAKIGKMYLMLGAIFFILFMLFIPQISVFFKIQSHFLLIIANIAIFMSFFSALNMAFLQARLSFTYISVLAVVGAMLKMSGGALLITMGYAVNGAVVALFISLLIPFLISFSPLKSFLKRRTEKSNIEIKKIVLYGLPSAMTVIGMTSFITTDILLVKHFFSLSAAGYYASISIIAKVIFYFSSPISTVMFPLVVQKINKHEKYTGTFGISLLLVLLPSVGITGAYFLLPNFILHIFHVKNISLYDIHLLGYFGIFISLYAVLSIMTNFYLSINKTKIFIPIIIAAIGQILGIYAYHTTFYAVILVSLTSTFLLLLSLLLYYPYATRE